MKANDQPGKFTGPSELRIERILPGPIERIWEYLTDPEKRSRWFAGGAMEPRTGGKFTLNFQHKNIAPDETPPAEYQQFHDRGASMDGVITRWEPPRVLAYTFGSTRESEVTFELIPQGKNVLLVLTHRSRGEDLQDMADFGAGWHTHLTHLLALLDGAPRPAFWPVHAKLKADYEKLRLVAQKP